jgi:hypothetical protein
MDGNTSLEPFYVIVTVCNYSSTFPFVRHVKSVTDIYEASEHLSQESGCQKKPLDIIYGLLNYAAPAHLMLKQSLFAISKRTITYLLVR